MHKIGSILSSSGDLVTIQRTFRLQNQCINFNFRLSSHVN